MNKKINKNSEAVGEHPVITADIGGTSLRVALVSQDGTILHRYQGETSAVEGPRVVTERLFAGIEAVLEESRLLPDGLQAISIAFAGIIDMDRGIVTGAPHLPGWENVPLKEPVEKRFSVPVFVLNDADAAAIGEYRYGAGKGLSNIILLTLGTGIGGGIIHDGKLFTGSAVSAAEFGHMIVKDDGPACTCGRNGCLETLASGTAIAAEAKLRIAGGEKSVLTGMTGGRTEDITAEMVHRAALDGDSLAEAVIERAAYYLGIGILNLVAVFNPEMVIIGGSVAEMGELLFGPARAMVMEKSFKAMVKDLKIVTARLGNDAGLVGAAACAFETAIR
jgi:glucokinase